MSAESSSERRLFGGAIASTFPLRFQDVSNIRQVPDHQEVFVDPSRDESLIFELLDFKHDVGDNGSAAWFLQDLASEQDADGCTLLEQSGVVEAPGLRYRNIPTVVTTAVGQMHLAELSWIEERRAGVLMTFLAMISKHYWTRLFVGILAISKGRQGREAQNIVRVYLANLRLKEVGTDVLVTAYEPILINPLSESATAVGAGLAIPAAQSGFMPLSEVFKLAVSSFKVNDWSLFGGAAA